MNSYSHFSQRLDNELYKKFKNPAELARVCGLTPTAISYYLNDRSMPKSEELLRLSRALGVSMEYLLTGEPEALDSTAEKWKARALAAEQRIDQITASIRGILDQSAVAVVTTELPATPKMRPESKIATGNESAGEETA